MRWLSLWFIVYLLLPMPGVQAQVPTPDADTVPNPVPLVNTDADAIINFLLLGSDTANPSNSGRTDVILVVSVNETQNAVALLSVPRDLYVFIPGWKMQRVNTAYAYGENTEPGQGASTLIETLRFNLGLNIDYYARVDFNSFKQIIDSMGGIDVVVDCAIEDWQLRDPGLDPTLEASWELYTLPIGVHHIDGELALWYVRSRRTSSDFDRGRRQQAVIRTLWQHVRGLGILYQLSELWPQLLETIETDVPLSVMLQLVPLATTLDASRVSSYTFQQNQHVEDWRSPEGSSVLIPVPDSVANLMNEFISVPTLNQLAGQQPTIRVLNASGDADLA